MNRIDQHHLSHLALCVVLCLLAACGNNETPDPTPDMSADVSADMSADMTPRVDMKVTGPDGCATGTWFESASSACKACPAPTLTCADLDLEGSSIEYVEDIVTLEFKGTTPHITNIKLEGEAGLYGCDQAFNCFTLDWEAFSREGARAIDFSLAQNERFEKNHYKLQKISLTTQCGETITLAVTAEWKPLRGTAHENKGEIAPLRCAD